MIDFILRLRQRTKACLAYPDNTAGIVQWKAIYMCSNTYTTVEAHREEGIWNKMDALTVLIFTQVVLKLHQVLMLVITQAF